MASRGKKFLVGCGLGCGALILIAVAAAVGFFLWVNRPGELVQTGRLLGSDTTGYVEWTLRLEDPGTRKLADRLLEVAARTRNNADSPLPPALNAFLGQIQNRRNEEQMEQLFPIAVAWVMRPDDDTGDDLHVWTASLATLGNRIVFADWIMAFAFSRTPDMQVVSHLGEKIYVPDDGDIVFFLRNSAVFFATDLESAKQAVERLDRGEPGDRTPTATESRYSGLPTEGTLKGVVTNPRGELSRLWDAFGDDTVAIDWGGVSDLSVSGGFTEDASFVAHFELNGIDAAWSAANLEPLTEALRARLPQVDHPIELRSSAETGRVRIELIVPDLPGLVQSGFERSLKRSSRSGDE